MAGAGPGNRTMSREERNDRGRPPFREVMSWETDAGTIFQRHHFENLLIKLGVGQQHLRRYNGAGGGEGQWRQR